MSAFIALIGIYPPGTYVELSDGRTGMVTNAGKIIDRPRVRITRLTDGTALKKEDQYDVDLGIMDRKSMSLKVKRLLLNYLAPEQ